MTQAELPTLYDRDVRGSFPSRLPPGWVGEQDGPLTWCLTPRGGFAMFTRNATFLTARELGVLVARTLAFYDDHDRGFEWKTFDHDRGDLRPLLVKHGPRPEPHEALVLGDASALVPGSRARHPWRSSSSKTATSPSARPGWCPSPERRWQASGAAARSRPTGGRGIYRALVSRRAAIAVERGYSTLQVDASDDSRPILERLGLHVVGGTVPYVTTRGPS